MSDPATLVVAAHLHALSLSLPSTDGARGALVMYERWLPERKLALGVTSELRESAIGDYTGLRAGIGARGRLFLRRSSWLSKQPDHSMVGWFVGGGFTVAGNFTHDDVEHRWLGTTMQLGANSQLGYRIAPWRDLAITPSIGLEVHHDFDTSGRLAGWTRGGIAVGLEVGWLF